MEEIRLAPSPSGSAGIDPVALLRAWWEAVGPQVARAATLRGISNGRLIIAIPDQRWEREIGELRDEIESRLRRKKGLEHLLGIDLVLDPEPLRATPPDMEGPKPGPVREAPVEIAKAARSISDTSVADRWVRMVARFLSRVSDSTDS